MICGKTVNGVQVVPECFHVLAGAQHRPYLTSPFPNATQVLLTQEEVVRRHLACHRNALLLCCLDDQDLWKKNKDGGPHQGLLFLRARYAHTHPAFWYFCYGGHFCRASLK